MKAKKFNARKVRANILKVYSQARPDERESGMYWYETAHNDARAIAERHGVTVMQAGGVIAAISPGLEWGLNLIQANEFIGAFKAKRKLPSVGAYGRKNVAKALRILNGENPYDVLPLTGPKVRAFYYCISEPLTAESVCIDRHARCLAYYKVRDRSETSIVRPAEFRRLAAVYVQLARELGLRPHQLQAITWVTWKRIVSEEVPF
jgi:hypothetical protein